MSTGNEGLRFVRRAMAPAVVMLSLATLAAPPAAAQDPAPAPDATRPDATRWVWNLADLYATPEAWQAEHDRLKGQVAEVAALEAGFAQGPAAMAAAFDTIWTTYRAMSRLYSYASLRADEDVRIAENQARLQQARMLYAQLQVATSWIDPAIIALGEPTVRGWLEQEEGLADYAFYLENVLRRAPHTLSPEAEAILAGTSQLRSSPENTRSLFFNGELPWPEVTLSTGETVTLTPSAYTLHRAAPNRADRQLVFDTFFGAIAGFESTLGATLDGQMQALQFETRQRKFEGSLDRALFSEAMPVAVYDRLIGEVNAALPTLHRYFRLRGRMLEVEDLSYMDIYPPLVSLDKVFTIEESIALTRRALAPLGEEFIAAYDEGVEGGWIHVYPQPGKRAGAYMSGSAYDVHPYVLLNHNDDYEGASTFAHEYGHAVHSILANRAQPYPTAGYSTFIAESASIMNEQLLSAMLIREAATPDEKLFYLGQALEMIRGTYFRQAMFGEIEREINALADAGEPINGERLTALYLETLRRYHGHDAGVMRVDEAYGVEWGYIPHFFYDFYLYQYATSIAAASWFAERIVGGDEATTRAFIDMLKAGGSGHPFELMRAAGLDLSEATAHDALERRMNAIMDEMEAILAEQGR